MVCWSLLTDFDAMKRAGVPISRSLNIQFRLKQQARMQGVALPNVGWAFLPVNAAHLCRDFSTFRTHPFSRSELFPAISRRVVLPSPAPRLPSYLQHEACARDNHGIPKSTILCCHGNPNEFSGLTFRGENFFEKIFRIMSQS